MKTDQRDASYPLQPCLMTPVLNAEENVPVSSYTQAHIRTRNVIERFNGIFKARFRSLLKYRVLHYYPAKATKISYACAALNNFCIERNIDLPDFEVKYAGIALPEPIENIQEEALLPQAYRIRRQLIRHFGVNN
ncbi:hypothetical protein NQ314_008231 [Rhamnusium bicolor]|uniref:DDE Tnp4 domain-containing protein n=1 Tax=Rhamnusium bicolor TaxID=1586634 RepID=A0AAV8YCK7_9CUCU|nr:hypothetical protein NQ314_008231 [Rhamnusium bicolor]